MHGAYWYGIGIAYMDYKYATVPEHEVRREGREITVGVGLTLT